MSDKSADEVADEYMNYVYDMCAAYEQQSYMEGIKVGARLMMELMGWESECKRQIASTFSKLSYVR